MAVEGETAPNDQKALSEIGPRPDDIILSRTRIRRISSGSQTSLGEVRLPQIEYHQKRSFRNSRNSIIKYNKISDEIKGRNKIGKR